MNIKLLVILQILFLCSCENKNNIETTNEKIIVDTVLIDTTLLETNQLQKKLDDFKENSDYFIRDIDLNADGIIDKIVSSEKYQGDELYLFINKNNHYELVVETINLSEDGGKIIGDITSTKDGNEIFKIHTFFPDGGYLQATHYISYTTNNKWLLKRTIYETSDWKESNDIYVCEVQQNIPLEDLNSPNGFKKFNHIPDEIDKDKLCTKKIQQ